VALTHHRATLDVRQQVAALDDPLEAVRRALDADDVGPRPLASECVVLRTCNRFEIYAVTTDVGEAVRRLQHLLDGAIRGHPVAPPLVVCTGDDAARHLLRVTAGLESMVVGESHVVHQVRAAFKEAQACGSAGAVLSHLFRSALQTGKRARAETALGRIDRSIATVAVDTIWRRVRPLAGSRVLVLGAGRIAQDISAGLVSEADVQLAVVNRTRPCRGLGAAKWFEWDDLDTAVTWADVIVAATAAPHVVLGADVLKRTVTHRTTSPLLIVDVGVPRNVDRRAGELADVLLVHLDALGASCGAQPDAVTDAMAEVEAIVAEELARITRWRRDRLAAPLLRSLHERAAGVVDAEVERALRRLVRCPDDATAVVESVARRVSSRLLHEVTVGLRSCPTSEEHAWPTGL